MKCSNDYLDFTEQEAVRYLEFWKAIAGIETPSADREALNHLADYIETFCLRRDFLVERRSYEKAGDNLIITLPGDPALKPAALLAHMDTVHAKGAFGKDPVWEENGILRGPGVHDCKGGIAVALLAMETVRQSGMNHRTIRLLLDSDEESGAYLGEARAEFFREQTHDCAYAISCELGKEGRITVSRKGVMRSEINIKGRASHAGIAYFSGVSAIREAAHKIIALEKFSEQDGITFNCGVIQGGSVTNIVPEACRIGIDTRFKNAQQLERAKEILHQVAATSYVEGSVSELKIHGARPAMEKTEQNVVLAEVITGIARELELEAFTPFESGGGSDAVYPTLLGIPTVCSMGVIGQYEHTTREEAAIASLPKRAKLLAACMLRIE